MVQNQSNTQLEEEEVQNCLERKMKEGYCSIYDFASKKNVEMRQASYTLLSAEWLKLCSSGAGYKNRKKTGAKNNLSMQDTKYKILELTEVYRSRDDSNVQMRQLRIPLQP